MMTIFYVIDFIYNLNEYYSLSFLRFLFSGSFLIFSVGPPNCSDRP
jgi:hypothetical protein